MIRALSGAQARRVAVAAQGFTDPEHHPPTMRTLVRSIGRTQVLQIDSVNVLQRAHYLPPFSRMGRYDLGLLHRAAEQRPRRLVEYWAHVAAYMPVELWPAMRHRMRGYRETGHEWVGMRHRPELVGSLMAEVRDRGACTARDLDRAVEERPRVRDQWGWNWSETKKVLEYLFSAGELAVARRNAAFERVYDLPERVLPRAVLDAPELSEPEAHRELVRRAARAHGVATTSDLADYFRMRPGDTLAAVASLVADGELVPVEVDGWGLPAYLHHDARIPRRVDACAVISPFDPLVWERRRTGRVFGFRYRIEIYVPAAQRRFGYYVLPFLLGDRLVARVDLKADRPAGLLRVHAAYAEAHAPPETAQRLAGALLELAGWLGVAIGPASTETVAGDLGPDLAAAVAGPG